MPDIWRHRTDRATGDVIWGMWINGFVVAYGDSSGRDHAGRHECDGNADPHSEIRHQTLHAVSQFAIP
jgi:hypothetical protein